MRKILAVATGLVLAGALAGCATSGATPSSTPTTAPTTAPSPSAAAEPTSRFGAACPDLVDADALATDFGITGAISGGWAVPVGGIDRTYLALHEIAVLQAGSLVCRWGDPEAGTPALDVTVAPFAADLSAFLDPSPAAPGARESGDCAEGCTLAITQDGATVLVRVIPDAAIVGESAQEDARALALGILTTAVDSGIAPAWEPTDATAFVPSSCEGLIATGTREESLGALTPITVDGVDPVTAAAFRELGALDCSWNGQSAGLLQLVVIPGGSWAWTTYPPRSTSAIDYTPRSDIGDGGVVASSEANALVATTTGGALVIARADIADPEELVIATQSILGTLAAR